MCPLVSGLKPVAGTRRRVHSQILAILWGIAVVCVVPGCKDKAAPSASSPASNAPVATSAIGQSSPTNNIRSFSTRGIIRELSADGKTVMVRHEEIPGFMPKMTMEFDVRYTNELAGLQKGDAITFLVKATEEDSWIEGIQRASTNGLAPLPSSDPSAAALLHVAQLKPGDLLPDASLMAEDGRIIKLSDYAGQALAFTFIFTRCPLPDFCPRMNQMFSRAREILLKETDGSTNWQFLSISFDPEFDRPSVLARYANLYRDENPDRWLFASAQTNVVMGMSPLLDFRFANESGSFLHNLRTVVLDPQRRIHKQFDGNSWKAEELARAMSEAARLAKPGGS